MHPYIHALKNTSRFKKCAFLVVVLLMLLLFTSLFLLRHDENQSFKKQTASIFQEEMTSNTLNMHYTLAHPENYGISEYEAILPCYSAEQNQGAESALTDRLQELSALDSSSLSETNRHTYTLLLRYLQNSLEGCAYTYYDEPLSPSSGMQSQLPILLAEYTFRTRQDVEDYLALLDQVDEYFASLIVYEQEKKEAGLLQSDASLQKVMDQCSEILSKEELEEGTHFLQTTFSERLSGLTSSGILTTKEGEYYESVNQRLLNTVVQPAYDRMADDIFLLMEDGSSTPYGLATLPEGKAYYGYLVRMTTGSDLTVEEIKDLLYPRFEQEYAALYNLLHSRTDSVQTWSRIMNDTPFFCKDASAMLTDLQNRMIQDFPAFPTENLPGLTLKTVTENLQEYCAPAFYLTPPLDDIDSNIIYINEKSTPDGLDLYTTLAHEGYPGHLYQSVYSQAYMLSENTDPIRQLLWYGGYQEGWALYVEFLSYDYAAQLALENGDTDAAFAYELEKHNRSMQLCLYSILDVSIHYDNASYEAVHQVLTAFGIKNADTTRAIFDYIAEEPSNYLKYYLGYMEVIRLKDQAQDSWGNEYSDLRFHQFFLENGPSDFTTLSEQLFTNVSSALP